MEDKETSGPRTNYAWLCLELPLTCRLDRLTPVLLGARGQASPSIKLREDTKIAQKAQASVTNPISTLEVPRNSLAWAEGTLNTSREGATEPG